MSSDVRTPITETYRILKAMDSHFTSEMRDEEIGRIGLMGYAVIPMRQNPAVADRTVQQWHDAKKNPTVELPTYLGYVHLVCAYCVQSEMLHVSGKMNESWAKAMDAQIHSGVALSLFVSRHEVKAAASNKGRDSANKRHAKDPKQTDKNLVKVCWEAWQKNPSDYVGKSAFALDMLKQFTNLKNQAVIVGWCRGWERKI